MEQRRIFRCRCPLPVTNRVSSHRSACRLSANTNTSVSGKTMSILVAPDTVASTACNSSFVPASSWLLSRYCMSLCVPLHILSHVTVTRNKGLLNGFPCRIARSMHAGCCESFGKRKNTRAAGEYIFMLSESRATSQVHGSRYPARKTI